MGIFIGNICTVNYTMAPPHSDVDTSWNCIACRRVCMSTRAKYICHCKKKHILCKQCHERLGGSWSAWSRAFGVHHELVDHEHEDLTRMQYALKAKEAICDTILEQLRSPLGPIGVTMTCGDFLVFIFLGLFLGSIITYAPTVWRVVTLILYYVVILSMQDKSTYIRMIENLGRVISPILFISTLCVLFSSELNDIVYMKDYFYLGWISAFILCAFGAIDACSIHLEPKKKRQKRRMR